ncbi:MFS transporter [Nonlabens tegetincola]
MLLGGAVGQFIEFYDFGLYSISAVTLSRVFFPESESWLALLATFATFGVAFLVRPLGGLFFGRMGDRRGRRVVLFVTILLIGVATAGIGLLPGYAEIGVLAPLALLFFRLVQGFSAGGESVGAPTFALEHAPLSRRGLWLGVVLAASSIPVVVSSVFLLLLESNMSAEAFAAWGWRVPFVAALPLSLIGLWIRSRTEESEEFLRASRAAAASPSAKPARPRLQVRTMVQVILLTGLIALGFYYTSGYLVAFLQTTAGLTHMQTLTVTSITILVIAAATPVLGLVGDRVGRRPMMLFGATATVLLALPAFFILSRGTMASGVAGQLLFGLAVLVFSAGAYPFAVEVFSTKVRFTSAALSYNIGYGLFGGTAPLLATWLVGVTGQAIAPGIYAAAFAAVILLLLIFGSVPETHPLKAPVGSPHRRQMNEQEA